MTNKITTPPGVVIGWYKPATQINYGTGGLTGAWWKGLTLIFDFLEPVKVFGTRTDYDKNAYQITVDGSSSVLDEMKGSSVFTKPIVAQVFKVHWKKTDGSNGFHFQFLGCKKG